jgi:hypothetical protein
MNRLLSTLAILLTTLLFSLLYLTCNDHKKILVLEQTVDSLTHECIVKDTAIDEATQIAIQLSDRLNILYERHPQIHKELFLE